MCDEREEEERKEERTLMAGRETALMAPNQRCSNYWGGGVLILFLPNYRTFTGLN